MNRTPLLIVDKSHLSPSDYVHDFKLSPPILQTDRIDNIRVTRPMKIVLVPLTHAEARAMLAGSDPISQTDR
ncbi:MAG: hypothetical protein AAF086_07580 [Planctomycetota bacterium]